MITEEEENDKSSAIYKLVDHLILGYLTRRQYKNSVDALSMDSMWFRSQQNRPVIVSPTLYEKRLEDIIELFFHYGRFDVPADFLHLEQQLRQLSNQFTEHLVNYSQINKKKAEDRHARFLLNQRQSNRVTSESCARNARLGPAPPPPVAYQKVATESRLPIEIVNSVSDTLPGDSFLESRYSQEPSTSHAATENQTQDDVNRRKKAKPLHKENVDASILVNHLGTICTTKLLERQNKEINDDWALTGVEELFQQFPIEEAEQIINWNVSQYSEQDSFMASEEPIFTEIVQENKQQKAIEMTSIASNSSMEDLFGNDDEKNKKISSFSQKLQRKFEESSVRRRETKPIKCSSPKTSSRDKGNSSTERHQKSYSQREEHNYKRPRDREVEQHKEKSYRDHERERREYEKRKEEKKKEQVENSLKEKRNEKIDQKPIVSDRTSHKDGKNKESNLRCNDDRKLENKSHIRRLSNASTSSTSTISERSPQKEHRRDSPSRERRPAHSPERKENKKELEKVDSTKKDKENGAQKDEKINNSSPSENNLKSSQKNKKAATDQQDLYREIFPNTSLQNIPKIPKIDKLSLSMAVPKNINETIRKPPEQVQKKPKEPKPLVSRGLVDSSKSSRIPKGAMSDARLCMILAKVDKIKRDQHDGEFIIQEDTEPDSRKRCVEEAQSSFFLQKNEDRKRRKIEPEEMERVLSQLHGP